MKGTLRYAPLSFVSALGLCILTSCFSSGSNAPPSGAQGDDAPGDDVGVSPEDASSDASIETRRDATVPLEAGPTPVDATVLDEASTDAPATPIDSGVDAAPVVDTGTPPADTGTEAAAVNPLCGNGVLDTGEICDGPVLNGASCSSVLHFSATGTLVCGADCQSYDLLELAPAPAVIPSAPLMRRHADLRELRDGPDELRGLREHLRRVVGLHFEPPGDAADYGGLRVHDRAIGLTLDSTNVSLHQ